MNSYIEAKEIYREMVSGIVFKERLNEYKNLIKYCETDVDYLKKYKYEYGEIDLHELNTIVKDIEDNKSETKDLFGYKIQIVSENDLKEKEYYLLRRPNNLFELVSGNAEKILKECCDTYGGVERERISLDILMYVVEAAKEYNFTIVSNNPYFPQQNIGGPVLFSFIDPVLIEEGGIQMEQVLYLIKRMQFILGNGTLDLR